MTLFTTALLVHPTLAGTIAVQLSLSEGGFRGYELER